MLIENPSRNRVATARRRQTPELEGRPVDTIWGRLAMAARRRPYLGLFLILLVAFTTIGANQVSAAGGEVRREEPVPDPSSFEASILKAEIYVHVVGEVVTPGLYLLASDARAADVIALAGGFTEAAEPASVNLARILSDGEQFAVLSRAEYAASGQVSKSGVGSNLISLNRATQVELESLPRVGPALAARIIDWRSSNGGFRQVRDLTKVSGFGDKMFAAVKDLVTL